MSIFRRKKPTQLQRVLDDFNAEIEAERSGQRRRIYTPTGRVAHYEGPQGSLCPNMQGPGWTWLGYTAAEAEYAAVLPLCHRCELEDERLRGEGQVAS